MSKRMIIDSSHPEETRVVVLEGQKVEEFDFESASKRPLKGNIYLAKVTRVEPSLQAAFVEYGGNRQGFLAFAEIHPDYYQIPVADRMALIAEQEAEARHQADEDVESVDVGTAPALAPDIDDHPDEVSERSDICENGTHSSDDVSSLQHSDDSHSVESFADAPMSTVESEEHGDAGPSDLTGAEMTSQAVMRASRPPQRWARKRHYKIQEVIKRRQIILVQVVKEERGNKGAAMTTYLSLAGRYCVLMPNTPRGGGISRKITSAADRNRLKSAAQSLELPEGMGLIIRTAGENRSKAEIKRDYEYLLRMWDTIRELTLRSNAPACVYEEGDLIKRAIRDLYNKDVSEILVEGDDGYRNAKDFMRMLMPSHAKNVKPYKEPIPLFQRYQVESQLDAMFMPTVTLRSGGYIVINQTEALVAIDVNSGKATREHSIEDTAYKTNLEAAEEIARQLRLRDLAGLIVIDFIDMEDARNDRNVEKRLRDCIKCDRARVQIGKISQFGLLEMSRQRLRAGVVAGSTIACPHCGGQGIVRSVESTALRLLRGIEEEAQRQRATSVSVRAPIDVVIYALNQKRREISRIEAEYGLAIQFEPRESMMAGTFEIDRIGLRAPEDRLPAPAAASHEASTPSDIDKLPDERGQATEPNDAVARTLEQSAPAQMSSRRRRRRGRGRDRSHPIADSGQPPASISAVGAETVEAEPPELRAQISGGEEPQSLGANAGQSSHGRKRRRRRRGRRSSHENSGTTGADSAAQDASAETEAKKTRLNSTPDATVEHALLPDIEANGSSSPVWSLTPEEQPTASRAEISEVASRGVEGSSFPEHPLEAPDELPAASKAVPEAPRKGWWQRPFRRND